MSILKNSIAFFVSILVPISVLSLDIGEPAPDFKLKATDGKTYTLSQFRGKEAVVVAWYPRAFTSGCTNRV